MKKADQLARLCHADLALIIRKNGRLIDQPTTINGPYDYRDCMYGHYKSQYRERQHL